MCVQFHAATIFYSLEALQDFPKGTVWCKDLQGEWYYYVCYHNEAQPIDNVLVFADKGCWPTTLHRDYWRHAEVKSGVGAPYFDAIRNAKYKTIR